MNLLLLGSGGREHAMAWKLSQSSALTKLYIAPGNAGTALTGTNLPIAVNDFASVRAAVLEYGIDMVIVGPEEPLVNGIADFFREDPQLSCIPVIGPDRQGARLEGSKDFAKQFMVKYGIPTAAYQTFTPGELQESIAFLHSLSPPYVLKADGLAAGKGVLILSTLEEAVSEITSIFAERRFGEAASKVVIEEFLSGIELSVFVITDGKSWKLLPEAKDYKRIGEGDTGPNTGGMGSVSPVPFATPDFMSKVEERIIRPTIGGLIAEGIDYRGFIFFGLMNVDGDPYVIEYNCRMGDPETESVLPRLSCDFVELCRAVAARRLDEATVTISTSVAATVMLVSGGYPGDYEKKKPITGLGNEAGSLVFHAGTAPLPVDGNVVTAGGRVFAVTALAPTMDKALELCYDRASRINFDGMYFRRDIGRDLCS